MQRMTLTVRLQLFAGMPQQQQHGTYTVRQQHSRLDRQLPQCLEVLCQSNAKTVFVALVFSVQRGMVTYSVRGDIVVERLEYCMAALSVDIRSGSAAHWF